MQRKPRIDAFGAASLVAFSALLGFNQVTIKVVNGGLQPVFSAGLRSLIAVVLVYGWLRLSRRWRGVAPGSLRDGLLFGTIFALEFILLYHSLDLTSVSRSSIIFYSMPVWMVIAAHLLIPGERLTPRKALGLVVALSGVAWALLDRDAGGQGRLLGDLLALGAAFCWTGIALFTRVSAVSRLDPAMQLFWQVSVSAVILLAVAPLFGPLLRDPQPIHFWTLGFQAVIVLTAGFAFWLWLLKIYPAGPVASFGFLSPVFGVLSGWLFLDEPVGVTIVGALMLVAAGIWLINAPERRR